MTESQNLEYRMVGINGVISDSKLEIFQAKFPNKYNFFFVVVLCFFTSVTEMPLKPVVVVLV